MNGKLVLAPLAGYTDKAFREISSSFGCSCAVTEMVSAEGLCRKSEKTIKLLDRFPGERNLTVQLFGANPDSYEKSIPFIMEYKPEGIDINAGCPVPKVVKTGSGSALMQSPERIYEIVKILKEGTKLPVSVKFRLGWDSTSINYLKFAEMSYKGGATALTLHARTRAQGYSGKADWEAFRKLRLEFRGKDTLLYASGDVFTPEDASCLLNEYEMDGVMFARGAIGNPFIFRETEEFLQCGSYTLPTVKEKIETALRHYSLMEKYFGEVLASKEMRKHVMAYIKGIRGAKEVKDEIAKANSKEEYEKALSALL